MFPRLFPQITKFSRSSKFFLRNFSSTAAGGGYENQKTFNISNNKNSTNSSEQLNSENSEMKSDTESGSQKMSENFDSGELPKIPPPPPYDNEPEEMSSILRYSFHAVVFGIVFWFVKNLEVRQVEVSPRRKNELKKSDFSNEKKDEK